MTVLSFGQTINVLGPNLGFPGTVSRQGERVITARQVLLAAPHNINFGDPVVCVPDQGTIGGSYESVLDYVATIANLASLSKLFAGSAVREVKTQLLYPNNVVPGVQQLGYYSPGQLAEVLQRGSMTVLLSVGAPSTEDQVYTRIALNANVAAGLIGDYETNPASSTATGDLFTVNTPTATVNSTTLTLPTAYAGIQVGMLVSGPGIAPNTYVAAGTGTAGAYTAVTLSNATQQAIAAGVPITFSNLFALPGCVIRTGDVDSNSMVEITYKNRVAA
jgi:hypothetical protein